MLTVQIKDAKPNMILAENLFTPSGQVIAKKGTVLTAPLLLHFSFYNIAEINIYESNDEKLADLEADDELYYNNQAATMSEYITNTAEFKAFKAGYDKSVNLVENTLNDIIKRQAPVDSAKLVSETKNLFSKQTTGIGMMNMLLNMSTIDSSTYTHSINVSIIARVLGTWLGFSEEDLNLLTMCGLLHDIGKCIIPNEILLKPGRLTDEEFRIMKKHPILSYQILENQDIDERIKLAALEHHEKCDGTGYPFGKKHDEINPLSMIITIADVYDAMTADRVYRPGMCPFDVISEFEKHSFTWYDAEYLLKFLSSIADSYVDAAVILSDDRRGKIVMINKNKLTKPLILLDNGEAVDLSKTKNLEIKKIL